MMILYVVLCCLKSTHTSHKINLVYNSEEVYIFFMNILMTVTNDKLADSRDQGEE